MPRKYQSKTNIKHRSIEAIKTKRRKRPKRRELKINMKVCFNLSYKLQKLKMAKINIMLPSHPQNHQKKTMTLANTKLYQLKKEMKVKISLIWMLLLFGQMMTIKQCMLLLKMNLRIIICRLMILKKANTLFYTKEIHRTRKKLKEICGQPFDILIPLLTILFKMNRILDSAIKYNIDQ